MIIGLTGPTGSGKSEISRYLKKKGFLIIDSDEIVRKLYVDCDECIDAIGKSFENVVENNGVNKRKLAKIVWNDKHSLLKLCEIVNPYILNKIKTEINAKNCDNIILDAPTLFESGAYRFCNYSLAILSKKQIRLRRILSRDNIKYDDAIIRIDSQPKDDFYIEHADEVVFNNNKLVNCISSVECILHKWL